MKQTLIILALLFSILSEAKTTRTPSNSSLVSSCNFKTSPSDSSVVISINKHKVSISNKSLAPTKKIIGCEEFSFPSLANFHFYKLRIIAHPEEGLESELCSIQERVYVRQKNRPSTHYQLTKNLSDNIHCDDHNSNNLELTHIKHKSVEGKNYIYIDRGSNKKYVSYYEFLPKSKNTRKVKYKGAIKKDFFN